MIDGRILVIEDEPDTLHLLVSLLEAEGWRTTAAASGGEGLNAVADCRPDLVLLELDLPGMDGAQVTARLREWYGGPIITLSKQAGEEEIIRALDLGADDHIARPFSKGELLARIRAGLRRDRRQVLGAEAPQASYTTGGLTIDFIRRRVTVDGTPVHLTQNEFRIVELLAWKPGQIVPYGYLMERIWGPYVPKNNKILRVNMTHIRRKLEKTPGTPRYITTEPGIGYRIAGPAEPGTPAEPKTVSASRPPRGQGVEIEIASERNSE